MSERTFDVTLSDYQHGVISGLLSSAADTALRDGRTGPWVDEVHALIELINDDKAVRKIHPTGGEPFGTKVTFWSPAWGVCHALIISSPRPAAERSDWLEPAQWGIVKRSGGMTFVDAEQLTLGWHPEATD